MRLDPPLNKIAISNINKDEKAVKSALKSELVHVISIILFNIKLIY